MERIILEGKKTEWSIQRYNRMLDCFSVVLEGSYGIRKQVRFSFWTLMELGSMNFWVLWFYDNPINGNCVLEDMNSLYKSYILLVSSAPRVKILIKLVNDEGKKIWYCWYFNILKCWIHAIIIIIDVIYSFSVTADLDLWLQEIEHTEIQE